MALALNPAALCQSRVLCSKAKLGSRLLGLLSGLGTLLLGLGGDLGSFGQVWGLGTGLSWVSLEMELSPVFRGLAKRPSVLLLRLENRDPVLGFQSKMKMKMKMKQSRSEWEVNQRSPAGLEMSAV